MTSRCRNNISFYLKLSLLLIKSWFENIKGVEQEENLPSISQYATHS